MAIFKDPRVQAADILKGKNIPFDTFKATVLNGEDVEQYAQKKQQEGDPYGLGQGALDNRNAIRNAQLARNGETKTLVRPYNKELNNPYAHGKFKNWADLLANSKWRDNVSNFEGQYGTHIDTNVKETLDNGKDIDDQVLLAKKLVIDGKVSPEDAIGYITGYTNVQNDKDLLNYIVRLFEKDTSSTSPYGI